MIGQKGLPTKYGGIERHVEELAVRLTKQGHDVLAYVRSWYTPKTLTSFEGITLVHTPTLHSKHLDAIVHTFISSIHASFQKADVIHYHGVGPSLLSFIPRILSPKTKVISTFHCLDRYHQKWGFLARLMLRLGEKAACVFPHETIAVSKTIQNYCLNEYQKNTTFIPNGVTLPEQVGASTLTQWNLEPQKYVLMVSRLVKHKGAHYLIEAWQFLKKKYPALVADQKLVIVGGSAFTDSYVEGLKKNAATDQSIIFTDWQHGQALEELYGNATLLVHPSENEGLPLTVLQAMAHGRPVLVSDIPEHQEIIANADFHFRNASIPSLIEKLVSLLGNQKQLAEIGLYNKTIVTANYQWDQIGLDTVAVYGTNPTATFKTVRAIEA